MFTPKGIIVMSIIQLADFSKKMSAQKDTRIHTEE